MALLHPTFDVRTVIIIYLMYENKERILFRNVIVNAQIEIRLSYVPRRKLK